MRKGDASAQALSSYLRRLSVSHFFAGRFGFAMHLIYDLDLQDDIWKRGRDQIVSGDFTDVLEGHARYTQNTWLRTLDDFRAVPSTPGSDLKAFIIKRWVKHGEIYGLDEATERRRVATGVEPARSPLPSPMMPCHYSLCLRADHAASYRMRVCKGCWGVFYCCKNCQKKYVSSLCIPGHI